MNRTNGNVEGLRPNEKCKPLQNAESVKLADGFRTAEVCERCKKGSQTHRVSSDILNMWVCTECADEAERLNEDCSGLFGELTVEVIQ